MDDGVDIERVGFVIEEVEVVEVTKGFIDIAVLCAESVDGFGYCVFCGWL